MPIGFAQPVHFLHYAQLHQRSPLARGNARLNARPDNCPTSIGQHSMHFGSRCGFVRNELQAMLANDTVESCISKWHVCSVAHTPFDRGGCFTRSARSREHARVEIEADNLSCRTD